MRLDQSEANQAVRLRRTEPGRGHQVPHQRQHARRRSGNLAEEVVGVRELELGSEYAPKAANGDADIEMPVLTRPNLGAAGVPAEVRPDKGADEGLRAHRR